MHSAGHFAQVDCPYGVSSIEPNDSGRQMDGAKEVARRFVVTRGDGAVLFESGKEVFVDCSRTGGTGRYVAALDGAKTPQDPG